MDIVIWGLGTDTILDFRICNVEIWHMCCLFLDLEAALQWSDVIFWSDQTFLAVLKVAFTRLVIVCALLISIYYKTFLC